MWYPSWTQRCVLSLVSLAGCGTAFTTRAQPAPPVEPSTYVYDAPDAPANATAGPWQSRASGWSRLEEDDKTHSFRGQPVLTNDKIVAILEADTPSLAVYSRQTQGTKLCARLQPVCDGSADLKRVSIAIKANSRSTATLEIAFRSAGNAICQITYELSAGQPFIKATGGTGVERLRVLAPCRFAVLPDFFADDIVVDASTIAVSQAELPSENFLLHMIHGGEAIVMTVSESRDNDVVVGLSGGASREIASSDVFFGRKPHIWVTVLAEQGIWHQRAIAYADAGKVIELDWRMPFAALWRVDWSKTDNLTESWEMLLQDPSGKYVMQNWFGQKESEGQSFGSEFGPRDWNKPNRQRWNPVLGAFKFPCWIDSDRSGHLQPLEPRKGKEGAAPGFAGPVIVYPIDRVQAAPFTTPLEKLTVVDLVRMTLGVGPCEYILDLEGQKRNSRGVATCYARDVINAIYKFGHEMTGYLEEQKRLRPAHAAFFDEMLAVTKKLDEVFDQNREKFRSPAFAQQTADSFRAKLLTYAGKDAYEKCAAQMGIFTSIGGAQDDAVASCRMIVKTLRQRAGIAMAVNPELKAIAIEIRQRTQVILRKATAYEAPRH
ncbi:MAG: hypothetical protein ABSH20_26235 [Tepidisphaeraceae bacterium]